MKKLILTLVCLSMTFTAQTAVAQAPLVRVKELVNIDGVRSNVLIGYGLVVGLAGTGDSANAVPFTRQTLVNILERMGINAKKSEAQLKSKNIAAVMVTAELPPFARQGSRIDVTISSLGDAKSLEGGQLLVTPLLAADGETYAIAQGSMVLGGFSVEGQAGSVSKNHTTAGRIANGAIIERELPYELGQDGNLRLVLRNADFSTAMRLSDAINDSFKEKIAHARDSHTVDVKLPERYHGYKVAAIQKIENLRIRPDTLSKVVIDEKTGTVVMGENVRLSQVAISHANLTIRISELPQVVQPEAFSEGGETAVVPRTSIEVDEGNGKFKVVDSGASLADLVDGLNNLGVKPRDIISILQTIKAAGAMQADIQLL